MDGKYTFEQLKQNLDDGYQIYYTYVRNRYRDNPKNLRQVQQSFHTQKLLSDDPKNPQPRQSVITLKRVKEMFPHMEHVEYKIGVGE